MKDYNEILSFDKNKGKIIVQSGALLSDIINIVLPNGWFPKIVPGTKYITVGGAIAADIHGKNHHVGGCFSESVNWLELYIPGKKIL